MPLSPAAVRQDRNPAPCRGGSRSRFPLRDRAPLRAPAPRVPFPGTRGFFVRTAAKIARKFKVFYACEKAGKSGKNARD